MTVETALFEIVFDLGAFLVRFRASEFRTIFLAAFFGFHTGFLFAEAVEVDDLSQMRATPFRRPSTYLRNARGSGSTP